MPFEYARDDVRKRLTITTSGALSLPEMLSIVDRQATDGAWTYGVLYFAQEMTNYPETQEMKILVARVAELASTRAPCGPVAIVDARPAAYGMWRMYSALAEDIPLRLMVFRDLAAAEAWLAEQDGAGR